MIGLLFKSFSGQIHSARSPGCVVQYCQFLSHLSLVRDSFYPFPRLELVEGQDIPISSASDVSDPDASSHDSPDSTGSVSSDVVIVAKSSPRCSGSFLSKSIKAEIMSDSLPPVVNDTTGEAGAAVGITHTDDLPISDALALVDDDVVDGDPDAIGVNGVEVAVDRSCELEPMSTSSDHVTEIKLEADDADIGVLESLLHSPTVSIDPQMPPGTVNLLPNNAVSGQEPLIIADSSNLSDYPTGSTVLVRASCTFKLLLVHSTLGVRK